MSMATNEPSITMSTTRRSVAIVLYEGFTALDAIGPYEVLVSLPDTDVYFVADQQGPIYADTGQLALVATATWDELPHPTVVVIPGGAGTMQALAHQPLLNWLQTAAPTVEWMTSVCTGVFVLGAAGLLHGLQVTSHWTSREFIHQYCAATYTAERFIQQGNIITAAGVSAGIDMALFLAQQLSSSQTAQAIQLAIEYDPQPPFSGAGDFQQADQALIDETYTVLSKYRVKG
ncbi:MAG TPA: DJ-1/PfpI family protein [Herpetosiphon sp.]|uniref:ThiJ/PfpI domain protein n=2 Tax=Herpetosiphon TaxID=64 RepID=A9AW88_HERA2|nr:ThiJ/PfpI domain protein [Herpetosiphon aurantiacus DSM 785]HBW49961.1 DJ-1/PfpI family protein [Herpetosiphon sp.]